MVVQGSARQDENLGMYGVSTDNVRKFESGISARYERKFEEFEWSDEEVR